MPAVSGSEFSGHIPDETDKHKILGGVSLSWIQVGLEQRRRAFYKQAEQSFLQAQQYRQYLTDAEGKKLGRLLESTRASVLERERVLEHIKAADELIDNGKPIKAKSHLEKVKGSRFLTRPEQKQLIERLKGIDKQLDRRKKEISDLYDRSVAFYRSGQSTGRLTALQQARDGFLAVAGSGLSEASAPRTAEDYLVKIDGILRSRGRSLRLIEQKAENNLPDIVSTVARAAEPQEVKQAGKSAIVDAAFPLTEENGRVESADRKRNILRSYARAVVEDGIAKSRNYINEGRYYKAKQAIEAAEQALNQSRAHIGDSSFNRYRSQLVQLAEQIVSGRARWLGD